MASKTFVLPSRPPGRCIGGKLKAKHHFYKLRGLFLIGKRTPSFLLPNIDDPASRNSASIEIRAVIRGSKLSTPYWVCEIIIVVMV